MPQAIQTKGLAFFRSGICLSRPCGNAALNEPRYLKLPDIMKAKRVVIEVTSLAALGVEAAPMVKTTKTAPPPTRSKGVMVKTTDELVAALKAKGLA